MTATEQGPRPRSGSDTSGVLSILVILLLVIVAGFIAYRTFATPTSYSVPEAASSTNGAPTTPSGASGDAAGPIIYDPPYER